MSAPDVLPVISEDGVVRFLNAAMVREAIPKLRRGSLTVSGKSPPRGEYTFQLTVGGAPQGLSARGDVVASIGGRAVLFFPEIAADLLSRLEANARAAPMLQERSLS